MYVLVIKCYVDNFVLATGGCLSSIAVSKPPSRRIKRERKRYWMPRETLD